MNLFQKGFNYGQDGPGNRLVYHLQGCNMRCKWCSNPEGMAASGGVPYTIDELADEARRSEMLFFDGGGVTLTGGEPTAQFSETAALLNRLRAAGIHTAIETNASHPRLAELLPYVDFLALDLKHFDDALHTAWTGVSNRVTKENIAKILASGRQVLLRIPLINGFNVSPRGFIEFFAAHNTANARFEVLPYHEYGRDKWREPYTVKNGFVSPRDLVGFQRAFEDAGFTLIHT